MFVWLFCIEVTDQTNISLINGSKNFDKTLLDKEVVLGQRRTFNLLTTEQIVLYKLIMVSNKAKQVILGCKTPSPSPYQLLALFYQTPGQQEG